MIRDKYKVEFSKSKPLQAIAEELLLMKANSRANTTCVVLSVWQEVRAALTSDEFDVVNDWLAFNVVCSFTNLEFTYPVLSN